MKKLLDASTWPDGPHTWAPRITSGQMLRQVAALCRKRTKFDPRTQFTNLALRLLAVSNAFHECQRIR